MHAGEKREPVEVGDWLRALFDESPAAIGFSRDGVMLDANPAYVRLFGYESVAELRGRSLLEQIAPSHRGHVQQMIAQRARGDRLPQRYETRGLRRGRDRVRVRGHDDARGRGRRPPRHCLHLRRLRAGGHAPRAEGQRGAVPHALRGSARGGLRPRRREDPARERRRGRDVRVRSAASSSVRR